MAIQQENDGGLRELALFAGAGGGILGGKLLGWRTVCAVEWDSYAASVLVARQNDGCLHSFPIWDDVQTFDGRPWKGRVDVVSGGFPCQDISAAGKGAGIEGERSSMWKHMARIIGEVRPQFAFVENSPLLVGRGLAVVLGDLAEMGYDARWGIVGAHHAGAPHKRDRIWIVATDANNSGQPASERTRQGGWECSRNHLGRVGADVADNPSSGRRKGGSGRPDPSDTGESEQPLQTVADAMRERSEAGTTNPPRREEGDAAKPVNDGASIIRNAAGAGLLHGATEPMGEPGADAQSKRSDWWATEPDVGRVADRVAARVDRLRCIGNGQVPAVAALAWRTLTN